MCIRDSYDDFTIAVQHAVNLAQSFLETITISATISDNQVRSVEGLINEFTNNPYAFEFAQLLAEHGAISNPKNQQATDNLLAILGSDRLSDPDYLSTILGQDLIIGDSYNSQILNGGIIGARNASIDSDVADKLKVRLSNIKALIGGDIFISQDAKIDVSNYLSPKQPGQGTKLFTIAAAKDLSILSLIHI